jgi:uracil-DNA glycosylase
MPAQSLDQLLDDIRACRACAADLPLGPRPVVRLSATARLMICSQAPGLRVHRTGLSFNDPSGDRLREWLGIDRETFYDARRVAILPMGFCYPGRDGNGGDLPPRPECAPLWQARVTRHMADVDLWLLVGGYAQRWHLGDRAKKTLTETVTAWREYLPRYLPLPHPSWRNNGWLRKNPWFGEELLPYLREQVRARVAA